MTNEFLKFAFNVFSGGKDTHCEGCGYHQCNCTAQRTVAEILAPPPEPEHDPATCAVCKTIDRRAMEAGMPVLERVGHKLPLRAAVHNELRGPGKMLTDYDPHTDTLLWEFNGERVPFEHVLKWTKDREMMPGYKQAEANVREREEQARNDYLEHCTRHGGP